MDDDFRDLMEELTRIRRNALSLAMSRLPDRREFDAYVGSLTEAVRSAETIREEMVDPMVTSGLNPVAWVASNVETHDSDHGSKLTPEELAEAERQVEIERSEGWLNARIR